MANPKSLPSFSLPVAWLVSCLVSCLLVAFTLPGSVHAFQRQEPEELLPLDKETLLFNGKDLKGWMHFTKKDDVRVEDVWTVEDGVLKCTGKPAGYLQTKLWYRDYEFELEWRWPEERGGNSGVLVHTTTPLLFYGWPKSMEVQLQAGSAGDFWVICKGVDVRVTDEAKRRPKPVAGNQHSHRRTKRLKGNFEKPVGQWNKMKVICHGDDIKVMLNGQLANHGTECTVTEGAIALQSEGTAIEFRNISLKPIVAAKAADDSKNADKNSKENSGGPSKSKELRNSSKSKELNKTNE